MSEQELKTTADIFIGGEKVTIKKLRAGKFYDAQKIIAEMFKDAVKIAPEKASETAIEKGKIVDRKEVGKKVPDIKDIDVNILAGMFDKFPRQVAKFVAICAEVEEKELLAKAYPEEISKAFGVCLELNNVMENLKNSVAPMEKLGVVKA